MGVKVVIVGAGSTYTPELVQGFLTRQDRLPIDELVLLDTNPTRLGIVGGFARRMLAAAGWTGEVVLTADTDAALTGADYILIQLRVGGQAARHQDESVPLGFGTIGQETTGAGGFAKALRTVPVVLDLAERAARLAAPGHWIVDFTNPVGIVTQALLDHGYRAIGLCNVAIGIQRRMAARFGVAPEQVELEHVGINHLTWERAIRIDGVDRLPEMIANDVERLSADMELPADLIRTLEAIPSYYLRYYYMFSTVLKEQHEEGTTRAQDVAAIEAELLRLYQEEDRTAVPELLSSRGGAFYSEAAAHLIASLHDGTGDVQVVNVRNGGALPDIDPDRVVEIPARIGRDGATPLPLAPLTAEMRGLVQHVHAYEQLTIDAALTGSHDTALKALLAHPLIGDWEVAVPLLDRILETDAEHLPRFRGIPVG